MDWVGDLLHLKRHNSLSIEDLHNQTIKKLWVTLKLFSYSLMTAQNLAHSKAKMLFLRCIKYLLLISWCVYVNTSWLFIDKTIIIAYNQLNLQSNWLIQWSNQLDYLSNQIKCSSQHLEITQEQCNWLDALSNRLKYSCSLLNNSMRKK